MVTICSSVNRLFFMTSFSPLEAILSSFNWSENSRAGHGDDTGKLVAIAVTLASTLALEAPHLTTKQLGTACEKFVQAIAAAEQDSANYRRRQYRQLRKAYRALYNDIDAQCTDGTRRLQVSALLRGVALGQSLAQGSSRLDIEQLKLATAVLKGEAA
ncbi:Uncharacterised protein [Burkholderia pseudomallei]|nr:Uncharacterised protein [Burkholderia pseudomallei]